MNREEQFVATVDTQHRITIQKNIREMLKIVHTSIVRASISHIDNPNREEQFIATVDSQNRITIPKNIRDLLNIKHNTTVRATISLIQSPKIRNF